jgi:hypothetical protein
MSKFLAHCVVIQADFSQYISTVFIEFSKGAYSQKYLLIHRTRNLD